MPVIYLEALITSTTCRYIWAICGYGSITTSYSRNLNMDRTQLLSSSKLRSLTPITACREMDNTGSMPYLPTSPPALRAAQTPKHKWFHPWAEHFSWHLGFGLQDSIPMPGGVSPWSGQRGPLEHPPHLYPPPHTPQGCRGSLPTHRLNAPAQQDRKIFYSAADAVELVLPEQEHGEGAKPVGFSGLSWCSLQAEGSMRGEAARGAPRAGRSFQKRFFILTKSSI